MNTKDCTDKAEPVKKHVRKSKRRVPKDLICDVCSKKNSFSWQCRKCGYTMCQKCMNENIWGLSCNGITWACPECGERNDLGNQ